LSCAVVAGAVALALADPEPDAPFAVDADALTLSGLSLGDERRCSRLLRGAAPLPDTLATAAAAAL